MISVVIPCYNASQFVQRAIDSSLSQTYQDIEIILVDNNSVDNTWEFLKKAAASHPEKIRIFRETKAGASAARNRGLYEAKGEWIQFLDADDELLPDKLENQATIIRQYQPELIIEDFDLISKSETGESSTISRIANENPWMGLITVRLGCTCSNLWQKELLMKVGGWNEDIRSSLEYDLLFRILQVEPRLYFSHKRKTIAYVQQESVCKSSDKEKLQEILNNRIELSLKIQKYLRSEGRLTAELKKASNLYIYRELLRYSMEIPRYAREKRKKLPAGLPLAARIKAYKKHVGAVYYKNHERSLLKYPQIAYYLLKDIHLF
ncbi:glycosyltransferase involved in cell wall biosynthesis [Anseongella ginsenosidimutans]|uniref:Glycosyltransferase involved in cell wall biosynthesis n=1 Tax=Anseongella ginsenosidimutans TaxID=496056 RepID=A0A4R3KLD9_9SPHI|nr:glycosyltransferase family A protein [Anseongella ginsenosidimutans]QEC52111.1 glycosyltransferase family 2 protein [Anseongella ginsenosidimutans]TCS84860.1 glycosyltransferase involved in cell wall biosynthesis [Anseongella ginsenosidimutans]